MNMMVNSDKIARDLYVILLFFYVEIWYDKYIDL